MSFYSLLLLLLLSLISSVSCQFSCPLSTNTVVNPQTQNFKESSGQLALTNCPQYSNDTCCTKLYDGLIGSSTDIIRKSFQNKIQSASSACSSFLSTLPCVICSPHQSVYFYSTFHGAHFRVCKSLCDKLYTLCKSENETLEAEDFCINVLQSEQLTVDVLPAEEGCYTTQQPECIDEDYAEEYGPCDDRNMRKLFYGLKMETACIGVTNRPPIENLPCNISCYPGYYLPVGQTSCSPCSPGSISVGSGTRIEEWSKWPSEFESKTYIINEKNATTTLPGWKLNGDTVSTVKINDSQSAILSMTVKLIEDGYVRFQFRVNSEPLYDGLLFEVDGVYVTQQIISSVLNYQYMKVNLTKGIRTLTWKYVKDYSFSMGDDSATIRALEVHGTKFANDDCTKCPPGRFNSNSKGAYCTLCPVNTYSDGHGSTACKPCKDDEYSYIGASTCHKRLPCTESDYYSEYTPCRIVNGEPKRDLYYDWKDPLLCNYKAFTLPPNITNLDCAPCNPGTHRVGASCEYCPLGSMNEGGRENERKSCSNCPAGTAAIPALVLDRFDHLPPEVASGCDGDCAVNEWQIYDEFLDSGTGHGTWVDIYFSINVTLNQPGTLSFDADIDCKSSCRLQYLDFGSYAEVFTRGPINFETKLTAGKHTLQWNFNKYDPDKIDPLGRATISKISIIGSEIGGAYACTPCSVGSYSSAQSSFCRKCSPGSSSNQDFTSCASCPANTYNPIEGGSCIPCGPGVQTPAGSTECTGGCAFVDGKHTYDLNSLKSPWMFGPLQGDSDESWFYLSICNRPSLNQTSCYDYNGDPISVLACSMSSLDPPIGCSLGDVMGFYPNGAEKGVIMNIQGGDCGASMGTEVNISFICDPLEGRGYIDLLDPPADTRTASDFYKHRFEWRTIFACPACTEQDYSVFYTSCQNNHRTKTYAWNDNPRHCYGGVDLPEDKEVDCEQISTTCDPGYYYSLDTRGCLPVPKGDFSVGGELFDSWDPNVADEFVSKIPDNCTYCSPWERKFQHIQSGKQTSSLEIVRNFIKDGTVTFEYRLFSPSAFGFDDFTLSVGDSDVYEVSGPGNLTWVSVTVNVPKGTHKLSWEYDSSILDSPGRPEGVSIRKIVLYGTADASVNTKHCPAGTFSAKEGSTSCTICPANTKSDSASSACAPCNAKQFSQPGSPSCETRLACRRSDYAKLYSACSHNTRSAKWVPLEPKICSESVDDPVIPSLPATEPCTDCPPGFLRDQNSWQCTPCSRGDYLSSDDTCVVAPAGTAAIKVKSYWIDNSVDSWPSGWSTVCNGACGTPGWRILGAEIDSGFHQYLEVDSSVILNAELEINGKIDFEYLVSGASVGLQFLVDGVPQAMKFSTPTEDYVKVSFDLQKGKRVLTWNYYQPVEFHGYAKLRNVLITGDITGGASRAVECPVGYYTDKSGQIECQPCPAGTYNPQTGYYECITCPPGEFSIAGSSKCFPCGRGTIASDDHTTCLSSGCVFVNDYNVSFNLSVFIKRKAMYFSTLTNLLYEFDFCEKLERTQCKDNETYVCAVSPDAPTKGIEMGRLLSFEPSPKNNGTYNSGQKEKSFSLVYKLGSNTKCTTISTTFDFVCEPDVKNAQLIELSSSTLCGLHLEYSLPAACRACEESDYKEVKSFCNDDQMTVKKIKATTDCYGDDVKDVRTAACSSSFQLSPTSIGIVVAIVIIVVALIGALIYVYLSNRKMEIEYDKLVSKKEDKEEKEMEDLSP